MAAFSDYDDDRLDWALFQHGAVTLYWRKELFERDIAWLRDAGYAIHLIDCGELDTFRLQMTRALRFKENYGYEPWSGNLDALNDAFRDLEFDGVTGIAFCLSRLDLLAAANRDMAQVMLDIIELQSRDWLLVGCRLLALGQTKDARIKFDAIGARYPTWNRDEEFPPKRGL